MRASQNYNSLSYDDKILDGFYDLYGVFTRSTSERMPSLVDLQGAPMSDSVTWEAVLINKAADANLLKLEQTALEMAIKMQTESPISVNHYLVRKLAALVSDHMGGPVGDPEKMLRKWRNLSYSLKATLGSMVLPLGSLTVGLARHRALLFKVHTPYLLFIFHLCIKCLVNSIDVHPFSCNFPFHVLNQIALNFCY